MSTPEADQSNKKVEDKDQGSVKPPLAATDSPKNAPIPPAPPPVKAPNAHSTANPQEGEMSAEDIQIQLDKERIQKLLEDERVKLGLRKDNAFKPFNPRARSRSKVIDSPPPEPVNQVMNPLFLLKKEKQQKQQRGSAKHSDIFKPNTPFMSALPSELQEKILLYLEPADLCVFMQCSKEWRNAIDSPAGTAPLLVMGVPGGLWRALCLKYRSAWSLDALQNQLPNGSWKLMYIQHRK